VTRGKVCKRGYRLAAPFSPSEAAWDVGLSHVRVTSFLHCVAIIFSFSTNQLWSSFGLWTRHSCVQVGPLSKNLRCCAVWPLGWFRCRLSCLVDNDCSRQQDRRTASCPCSLLLYLGLAGGTREVYQLYEAHCRHRASSRLGC
jgi:hypothetical protein